MAFTSSDLDSLDRAIASGELVVQYDGKRVEFRSIAELKEARALVSSSLADNAATRMPRTGLASRSRA
jgi:hypothetical protein